MKTFDIKRTLQLIRLEIAELLNFKMTNLIKRFFGFLICVLILSLIRRDNSFTHYAGLTERLYTLGLSCISFSLIYIEFLTNNKLLLPATRLEKYCSIYLSSLIVTLLCLLVAIIPMSVLLFCIQQLYFPEYASKLYIFIISGNNWYTDLYFILFFTIILFTLFNFAVSSKIKSRATRIISTIIIITLLVGPGLSQNLGWISQDTSHLFFKVNIYLLSVFLLFYNYILFKGVELINKEQE